MNHEIELKIQSWLDGELSAAEASQVAAMVTADKEAGGLVTELRNTKSALVGNELEMKVPETREFYWSKIARQIERESRQQAEPVSVPFFVQLRRIFMPLAGVAAVVAVMLLSVTQRIPSDSIATSHDMETVTFRDQASGMTVVWLQDRDDAQGDNSSGIETQ